ncbi:MAG: cytochrome oxidase putative small subunit CydP [Alphaproteobacteria bacterium]
MRRRQRLLREIGLALAFKAAALGVLYVAFFTPPHGVRLTSEGVSAHLLSPLGPSMER